MQSIWENLSIVATQFAIKKQLKDLTQMFCVLIPCHKLYKEGVFFLCSHIKIHVSFWDKLKKT
jgi:hypothetical protein